VQSGISISNSEVGCGSLRIEPLVFRLACLNGMIIADAGLRKYHVGRNDNDMDAEGAMQYYRNETRAADDKAFWMKVRDIVTATGERARFESLVARLQESTTKVITGDPIKAIELTSRKFMFSDDEKASVLRHLIGGGDLSAYGLANAVTRASQDLEDYDRATDFEKIGGI